MARVTSRRLVIVGLGMFGLVALGVLRWTSTGESADAFSLTVGPGEKPGPVPVDTTESRFVEVDADGALVVRRGSTVRSFGRPQAYQEIGGARRAVDIRYEISADGLVEFALGVYDHSLPLYINSSADKGQE